MARRIVESAPTGETFVFDDDWIDAQGRTRQIEYALRPGARVPRHSHPGVAQLFEVLAGRLHVEVNGQVTVLGPGDRVATGAGETHAQWNEGPDPVQAIEGYDPPIAIEPFFTVLPHAVGSRNPLKMAVFFSDFREINLAADAPLKLMIALFNPLGRLLGLTGWYRGAR